MSTDPKEKLKTLGLIFWWTCQAKPFLRGDPSIAEMLIKILSDETLPPWKQGVVPWVKVMDFTNPNEFADEFAKLGEGSFFENSLI
jgi:hypothetical protein